MTIETFFDKFDQFSDAPDAVAKMRELVLDLAMQGKLVERKGSEGDGHSLLKKLRTLPPERNSKSRSPKDIVVEPEIPLEIPDHWALTTVENTTRSTGFFCDGDWVESKDQDQNGDVRLIQLADVGDGIYRDRSSRFMTKAAAKRLNCSYLEPGDILVARMPDPLGRCCRFPGDSKPAVTVVDVCILRPNTSYFDSDFLVIAINNPRFRKLVLAQATGTTRSRISRSNLGVLPIPLPPLAEQKRIVAKVDELMLLCDRLEAQQQERDTRHSELARASLARFAEAPTPENLQFIFHKSYDTPPADLRKSILTLAVQGKLVPQDPNDEPVDALLKRSLAERRKLKRTDATEVQPLAVEDALSYNIPESWQWQRLDDLLVFGPTNGFSPKAVDYETPVRSLTLSATTSGRFKGQHSKFITTEVPADSDLWLRDGDILVQRGNSIEYVGVAAVYRGEPHCFVYPDLMMKLRVSSAFNVGFIHLAMSHETARDFLRARASGTSGSMPKINQTTLKNLPLPIPPLAEQRRIVAKVDQLMALVDELETQLATTRSTAANLLSALVGELTGTIPSGKVSKSNSTGRRGRPKKS